MAQFMSYSNDEEEEAVKPSTSNNHEVGPSGGPPGVINLDDDDKFDKYYRHHVMVEFLVHWNRSLTTQVDKDGSTPLHFASSMCFRTGSDLHFMFLRTLPWCRFVWIPWGYKIYDVVFNANPAALYQADKDGYFPIHVAASVGLKDVVQFFHNDYPDSAGLCDAKGRTFLHVAVDKEEFDIVSYVCRTPSLAWILNMQDNDGNTALHLAIEARNFKIFCALFGSRRNPECKIHEVLWHVGVSRGALRKDKLNERYMRPVNPGDEDKESHMLGNSAQIAAVLIATVAFTATFALPGGYRADDHKNGGTPTRAGSYAFDAFMMATTLAFICSIVATIGFVSAGIPMVNLKTRRVNSSVAVLLMSSSLTSMSTAFALGVYMVLAPVAHSTAVAVCAITPAVLISVNRDSIFQCVILARPLCTRIGLFHGTKVLLKMHMQIVVFALWPIIVTFGWAALARIHRHS
uniref:Uncharacterized protein n=1 Tax=Aegilops tauschii TaxID=37682 RepID=M8BQN6_AEGTA